MLPNLPIPSQKGYISAVLIIFALLMAVLMFPFKFPTQNLAQSDGFNFCREFVTDANAQTIEIPDKLNGTNTAQYKLIKQNVPINPAGYTADHHVIYGPNIPVGDKNFQIYYPASETGRSYDFNTEDGIIGKNGIVFADYGLVFLLHLNPDGSPETVNVPGTTLHVIDIYQDATKDPIPMAENILKCVDIGAESAVDPVVLVPSQKVSGDKDQVQMEWFVVKQAKLLPKAWWTPECKPAIYLYPPRKQLVNVKVTPQGALTYVDPPLDAQKGWVVEANPNGVLFTMNNEPLTHNYLYYESKIRDEAIDKPEKGWVVKYDDLINLYNDILPKLGLNEQETRDFVEYWTKSLPEAPYYFVGIVDPGNVDEIERLEITPKPDSINRVRIYFERLDSPKIVEEPSVISHQQSAEDRKLKAESEFHVTEWGGMVKNDLNHPFTCSQ